MYHTCFWLRGWGQAATVDLSLYMSVLEWVSVPTWGPACLIFSCGCPAPWVPLSVGHSSSSFCGISRLRGDLNGTSQVMDLRPAPGKRRRSGGVGWASVHGSGGPRIPLECTGLP